MVSDLRINLKKIKCIKYKNYKDFNRKCAFRVNIKVTKFAREDGVCIKPFAILLFDGLNCAYAFKTLFVSKNHHIILFCQKRIIELSKKQFHWRMWSPSSRRPLLRSPHSKIRCHTANYLETSLLKIISSGYLLIHYYLPLLLYFSFMSKARNKAFHWLLNF